jgi:hypothetical protein
VTDEIAIPNVASLLPLVAKGPLAFADEVGGWLLVGQLPDVEPNWAYRTEGVPVARAVRAPTGEVEAMLDERWAAWPLRKRPGNVFPDTIFVGRATNNDVCIPHTSVSKLHARVRNGVYGLILQDAGSSNGTMLNGDALVTGVDVSVSHGDLVRFGNVVFQCFEPAKLCAVLERFMATK